jgi:hypothetical protein
MVTVWNARKIQSPVSALAHPGEEKAPRSSKMTCRLNPSAMHQLALPGTICKKSFFERTTRECC